MITSTYIPNIKDLYDAIRVKHWIKNLLVPIVGLTTIANLEEYDNYIYELTFAFFAFCIASSSIYLINDLMDREKDRAHPSKRHRPIASGKINISFAYLLIIFSLPGSLYLAAICKTEIALLLSVYIVINVLYSVKLKNIPQIDIICVASGFTLRALAGALAVSQDINFWMLGTITFSCMALAVMKRMKEIKQLGKSGETRSVLKGYSYDSLAKIHDMFLILSVLTSTIYIGNLNLTDPLIKAFGLTMISGLFLVVVQKIQQHDNGDPTDFFYRNKFFSGMLVVFAFVLLRVSIDTSTLGVVGG